jgi:gamma-glutamylcyclotransferase (GGCT)/AIG2-like uncharacterized protein YtfP
MTSSVAENARETPYFAYGTTQRGFPHHRRLAALLGEPAGRFRTLAPHAVIVPRRAACGNPGCMYVHRMAALVPGGELHAEGDVFMVSEAGLAELDALETRGPYVRARVEVVALDSATRYAAHAFPAAEPARWRALAARGEADALAAYPRELATGERLKECCLKAHGHPGPHDVLDPLAAVQSARGDRAAADRGGGAGGPADGAARAQGDPRP